MMLHQIKGVLVHIQRNPRKNKTRAKCLLDANGLVGCVCCVLKHAFEFFFLQNNSRVLRVSGYVMPKNF